MKKRGSGTFALSSVIQKAEYKRGGEKKKEVRKAMYNVTGYQAKSYQAEIEKKKKGESHHVFANKSLRRRISNATWGLVKKKKRGEGRKRKGRT